MLASHRSTPAPQQAGCWPPGTCWACRGHRCSSPAHTCHSTEETAPQSAGMKYCFREKSSSKAIALTQSCGMKPLKLQPSHERLHYAALVASDGNSSESTSHLHFWSVASGITFLGKHYLYKKTLHDLHRKNIHSITQCSKGSIALHWQYG